MAAGTKVQLRLGDRVIASVALHNGELRIGEHVLTISVEDEEDAPVSRTGASDVWDAARACFAPELPESAPRSRAASTANIAAEESAGSAAPLASRTGVIDVWEAARACFAPELPELTPRSRAASSADIGAILFANAGEGEAAPVAEAAEERAAAAPVGAAPHAVRRPAISLDLPDPEGRFAIREEDLIGGQRPDAAPSLPRFSDDARARVRRNEPPAQAAELVGPLYGAAASSASSPGQPSTRQNAPFVSMPERDLITESDDEDHFWDLEKELEIVSGQATAPAGSPSASPGAGLAVEVVLGGEDLPPALHAALRELDAQALRLPAELRIRRRSQN